MKNRFAVVALACSFLHSLVTQASVVVDFEDLALTADSADFGDASQQPFVSHGVQFVRHWSTEFDCCPTGWAHSNKKDLTTAGFTNPYSAYASPSGGGRDGSTNFAVGSNLSRGEAVVRFPAPTAVEGVYVTNTTYSYLAVANGDDGGAGFVKGAFREGDWFKLKIIGLDSNRAETGSAEFFLADFRGQRQSVVSDWTWVDLSTLGIQVASLEFEMSSTDVGPFGMNTPAYFAFDDLVISNMTQPGDFDGDGSLDVDDIDQLSAAIRGGITDRRYDLDANNKVDQQDRVVWVEQLRRTYFGDSNLDGQFNSFDLVQVFQAGIYEDGIAGNANWSAGDWDGNGDFNSSDLVLSFQGSGYEQGPRAVVAAVPEPAGFRIFVFGLIACCAWVSRSNFILRGGKVPFALVSFRREE